MVLEPPERLFSDIEPEPYVMYFVEHSLITRWRRASYEYQGVRDFTRWDNVRFGTLAIPLAVIGQYCLFSLTCFKSWDQKLSSGLLLKFMFSHLFQFRFAVSEQSWLFTLTSLRTCGNTSLRVSCSSDGHWAIADHCIRQFLVTSCLRSTSSHP